MQYFFQYQTRDEIRSVFKNSVVNNTLASRHRPTGKFTFVLACFSGLPITLSHLFKFMALCMLFILNPIVTHVKLWSCLNK